MQSVEARQRRSQILEHHADAGDQRELARGLAAFFADQLERRVEPGEHRLERPVQQLCSRSGDDSAAAAAGLSEMFVGVLIG